MGLSLRAAWRRMRPEPTPPVPRGEGRRRGSGRPSGPGRRKPPRDLRLALRARCWSRLLGPEESVPVTSGRCRSYVALGVHPWGSGDMDNVCVSPSHTARETRREEPVPTHRERSRCACSHRALWRDVAGLTCARATLPKHERDPESPGCWARPTGSESAGLGRQPRCAAGRDHTSRPAVPDKARPGPGGGLWGAGGEDKPGAVSTHGRRGAGGAATLGPARTLGTSPSLVHTEGTQSCVLCPQPRAGATSTRPGLGPAACVRLHGPHSSTPAPFLLTAAALLHSSPYRRTARSSGRWGPAMSSWPGSGSGLPNASPEPPSQTSLA